MVPGDIHVLLALRDLAISFNQLHNLPRELWLRGGNALNELRCEVFRTHLALGAACAHSFLVPRPHTTMQGNPFMFLPPSAPLLYVTGPWLPTLAELAARSIVCNKIPFAGRQGDPLCR